MFGWGLEILCCAEILPGLAETKLACTAKEVLCHVSRVIRGEFIRKFKSGRGEKTETQRQSNPAQDFETSIWHIRYAQLSHWKLLGDNGLCPLMKGLNPQWSPEATERSRTRP